MTDDLTITITGERIDRIWEKTFGASPEYYDWVRIFFEDGSDWDKPGRAEVFFYDTDNCIGVDEDGYPEYELEGQAVVTPVDLWEALQIAIEKQYVDACTGRYIHEHSDWDVCVADVILQIAVLGEVVFG